MHDDIPNDGVRLIPLGGLGDIGRNMMVVETADDLVVVDAGIMFLRKNCWGSTSSFRTSPICAIGQRSCARI